MEVVFFLSGNGLNSGVSNVHGNGLIYVKIKKCNRLGRERSKDRAGIEIDFSDCLF